MAPANVVAVMTAGSAGARFASGIGAGAGVSCDAGNAIDDWPMFALAAAVVVVAMGAGLESMGRAMDEAPAVGRLSVAGVEMGAADDADEEETAGMLEEVEIVSVEDAAAADEVVSRAADVVAAGMLGSAGVESVVVSTAAELDTIDDEEIAAALEDESSAAAEEEIIAALDDDADADVTTAALEVLGSTTVARDVGDELNNGIEDDSVGNATTAA